MVYSDRGGFVGVEAPVISDIFHYRLCLIFKIFKDEIKNNDFVL